MSTAAARALSRLRPGSHVCWIVDDPTDYEELGAAVLCEAATTNEKPVVFGPEASRARAALAGLAALALDPYRAVLGGVLEPAVMFAMFEQQSAVARAEGYCGLRVVADMDWLLPLRPTAEDLLAFELQLDHHASVLGATIVCAYRTGSFDTATIDASLCVHRTAAHDGTPPQFKLVAGSGDRWELEGEVDGAVAAEFRAAIGTAVAAGPRVVDASALDFVDVGGMRAIAVAARGAGSTVQILRARPSIVRAWRSAGFADAAPTVEFAG